MPVSTVTCMPMIINQEQIQVICSTWAIEYYVEEIEEDTSFLARDSEVKGTKVICKQILVVITKYYNSTIAFHRVLIINWFYSSCKKSYYWFMLGFICVPVLASQ